MTRNVRDGIETTIAREAVASIEGESGTEAGVRAEGDNLSRIPLCHSNTTTVRSTDYVVENLKPPSHPQRPVS